MPMRTGMLCLSSSAVVAMVLCASSASAATFNVTTTNDSGPGSLRQAVLDANANAEADTITITATGTIQLATALPALSSEMTITGPGAANLTVRRNAAEQFVIFTVRAPVKLAALTLANGDSSADRGGGIDAQVGSLEIEDVVFTGNGSSSSRTLGPAIRSNIPLTVKRGSFTGNTGYGILYTVSQAATTLIDTTFANNAGTAIVFPPANGTLTIDRCTFSGNNNPQGVGAIQLQGGTAIIRDSTFSGNSGGQGGDFWTYSAGVTLRLTNVTSSGSSAPALLWDRAASVVVRNTILAGTGARCSLGGRSFTQGGHNIASDATCNLTDPTDKPSTDPLLGPLANNGGPTQTHALLAGSPAINAGDGTDVSATDQRGLARVSDGAVDIGAYEVAEEVDAGPEAGADASIPDATTSDASTADASTADASTPDTRSPDSGVPGDPVSNDGPEDSGCSCRTVAGGGAPWSSALLGTLALLAFARRRRSRRAGARPTL